MSPLLALYAVVLLALFVYGARGFVMAFLALRARPVRPVADPPEWPAVTVQLPIYNERYVLPRLLDAVAALDWPRDKLHVQVLDDSDDETREIAAALVARWREAGLRIDHVTRADRSEFKAGALRAGLAAGTAKLIAVFDADFVPPPDFLRRTVPALLADRGLACVQARWGHVNEDYSWVTAAQAVGVDGHFVVEQRVRSDRGLFMNFNGTAGVWRREAIVDAGGWTGDTVAEDLDLSYRAQLRGWRFAYVPDAVAPAELPAQVQSFKRQQHRWAKGSIQCLRKHGRAVLASRRMRPAQKVEAILHLSHYLVHPLMLALSLLLLPVGLLAPVPLGFALTLFGATFGPPTMYLVGERILHPRDWRRRARRLLPLTLLGTGIALSNTRAVIEGLTRDGGEFRRTPKFRLEDRRDTWREKAYTLAADWTVVGEAALAVYLVATLALAIVTRHYAMLPWAALLCAGYVTVLALTLAHRSPRPAASRSPHALPVE